MKLLTLITTASSMTALAFAGGSKEVIAPTPPPAPTLGGWFVGGTYGQLDADSNAGDEMNRLDPFGYIADPGVALSGTGYFENVGRRPSGYNGDHYEVGDFEFDIYTLHVGRDLGTQVLGFDLAAYLEVGYLDGEANVSFLRNPNAALLTGTLDAEIIPITLNLKLERPVFGAFNVYLTGGLGYAFTDASFGSESDSGGGFYAQATAGVLYNINSQLEVFAGARWVHLSNLDFGDNDVELDDSLGWEIGLRYNF